MALTLLDPTQMSKVWQYRRPVLQFASITTVGVEAGLNGTSGDVTVLFPDGKVITVNSTTQTTFNITRNCALSGTKQSGLRTSLSEATNTWYALYAVRATDNDDTWVTVGDTLLPIQTNYASLNSNFGGLGKWVYLGLIRNGDQGSTTGDILKFYMGGNATRFANVGTGGNLVNSNGMVLATTTSATSLSWPYVAGTSGAVIPNNISLGYALFCWPQQTTGNNAAFSTSARTSGTQIMQAAPSSISGSVSNTVFTGLLDGVGITLGGGATIMDIWLSGFIDNALGVGPNPLF